jgi:glycosyltransferase involved in cell wall biosynthesis
MVEIINGLEGWNSDLYTPKDIIIKKIPIHINKIKSENIKLFYTMQPPLINSEFPIPLNLFSLIKNLIQLKNYYIIHIWVPFYLTNLLIISMKNVFHYNKIILTMDTFPGLSFKMNPFFNFLFKIYYNTIGKVIFKKIDYLILYDASFKKYALKLGIENEKIKILPTGVETNLKKKTSSIRKQFHIKNNEKIILFVGLINERKGIDIIIKIADQMKEKENIIFLIVGDGPKKEEYLKIVNRKNLKHRVIFVGFRRDVHNFYLESDILLLPSRGEGLSGVIMESMTYGLPIVTTKIEGTRDLIKDGYNGFLCGINNINCFIDKIEALLNNKEKRNKFIQNSKKRVKESYNWEKNMKKYKEFYENL